MSWETLNLAGLDCIWFDPRTDRAQPASRVLILCHGFGAPGDDLVPVADALCRFQPDLKTDTLFVFPAAPLSLAEFGMPDGRAWWPIDMAKLQRMVALRQERQLREEIPAGLESARKLLTDFWHSVSERSGVALQRIVLGGFSQGAMLSTDVMLHAETPPAGLLILSGTLLAEPVWQPLLSRASGVPVFMSHGEYDPVLPYSAAVGLRELLQQHQVSVEFEKFNGGHEIPLTVLLKAARWLAELPRSTAS